MKKIYLLLIVFFGTVVHGQNFSTSMMENIKPRNIGPGGMSGRVTAIDVVNEKPDIIYVGTASGRSDFRGLNRINNTTTAVTTAISASNGLVAEQ